MLELREVRGLAITTSLKKFWRWDKRTRTSLPQNNFARNVPPGTSTLVVILKAASSNCACTYSSKSGSPVTATHRGIISQYSLSTEINHYSRNSLILWNLYAQNVVTKTCRKIPFGRFSPVYTMVGMELYLNQLRTFSKCYWLLSICWSSFTARYKSIVSKVFCTTITLQWKVINYFSKISFILLTLILK